MNWADITIISIIVLSAVLSLFRGFVREVLSLIAWVVAFWAAMAFWHRVSVMMEPYLAIEFARTLALAASKRACRQKDAEVAGRLLWAEA